MSIVVGIDASRNRSGGAKVHLVGILGGANPTAHGVREVHLWAYKKLLDRVPDYPWLVKHSPAALEKSLLHQVWWQYRVLPREVRASGCDILLNTDAGTVCPFRPGVTMSRDMLSFEWREMKRFGLSKTLLRLLLLRYIQIKSLKNAHAAIFLTHYAHRVIQQQTGALGKYAIIHHGVSEKFHRSSHRPSKKSGKWSVEPGRPIQCLYVSNTDMYKHQWNVVKVIGKMRAAGIDIRLTLVGGGTGRAQTLLEREMAITDGKREFVKQMAFLDHDQIPSFLAAADIFIFASSCENMPNTLIEAMASGLPIACSDRGPMPEILEDGGVYFDPEDTESIAAAIERIITDEALRAAIARRAKSLSGQYSWRRCADETWSFLVDTFSNLKEATA